MPVLDDRMLKGGGIFAVYPHRRYLPAKVRVFVDFLVQWFKKCATADATGAGGRDMVPISPAFWSHFRRYSDKLDDEIVGHRECSCNGETSRHGLAMRPASAATGAGQRAHPHVFAEARLDVVGQSRPDGEVAAPSLALRRLFSSTVLMEFDKNADLKLDDAELQEVSNTVFTVARRVQLFPARHASTARTWR